MNKDQIYELIGRPHFSKASMACANGIMCFTIVKTAKSKNLPIRLFDKHMNAQTFHWLPEGCPRPQAPQREVIVREVVASPKPIRQ